MKPFEVSTLIGESIIAKRVCRNCIVTVSDRDTLADLLDLNVIIDTTTCMEFMLMKRLQYL